MFELFLCKQNQFQLFKKVMKHSLLIKKIEYFLCYSVYVCVQITLII